MRITPLDIRKQEFRKTMRGLDADEVYAFLNTVAEEYETVLSDNKRLREHVVQLEERLKEYKNIEMNLRNTLLTAEKITAEAKENARREAGLIVREAEVEAEKAAEAIRAHTMQLRREILELKKQKDNYLTRLRTLLDSHRKVLEGFAEDFSHVDMEIEKIGRQVEEDTRKPLKTPRMSREKITEEYSGGPKDKVTWGEERRREDESRPTFPHPGAEKDKPAESRATGAQDTYTTAARGSGSQHVPPGNDAPASEPASAAQDDTGTSSTGRDKAAFPHLETEPIGALDGMAGTGTRDEGGDPGSDRQLTMTEGHWGDAAESRQESEARRIVTRSVEDKLHPENTVEDERQTPAGHSGEAADAPGNGHRVDTSTLTDVRTPGSQTGASPLPGSVEHSDHWKQYEVQSEKPDWKDYEIQSPEKSPEQHPAKDVEVPCDHEVEEALSSLTDTTTDEYGGMTGEETTEPSSQAEVPPAQKETPLTSAPSPEAAEHVKSDGTDSNDDAVDKQESSQETGAADEDSAAWSMEELKKNLTNFGQDT
jgi:cell division initiation protein